MEYPEPKTSLNLDTNFIKIIACASMLCDHVGKIFFPDKIILQIIGRISFPIFAYCAVVGFLYTRDIKKYALRLAIFAVFSQFFYVQAFAPGALNPIIYISYMNILFTLLIGVVSMYCWREKKWWGIFLCATAAGLGNFDYGFYGLLLIMSFYWFRDNRAYSFITVATLLSSRFFINSRPVDFLGFTVGLQGFSVLCLPFIYVRTHLEPKINKYAYYAFYPLHLFALYAAQVFI